MTTDTNVEYGEAGVADAGLILRTQVGSGLHGIAIEGTDDRDEMGIYIPPLDVLLSLRKQRDSYIFRTQPEGARSGPGDLDYVAYSLQKYLSLVTKGNPTVLLPLFAPESELIFCNTFGRELRYLRRWFLSRESVERTFHYMLSQRARCISSALKQGQDARTMRALTRALDERPFWDRLRRRPMKNLSTRNVPNRPELIEKYGWDVKYGSHALRLAFQGLELAEHGTITLPMATDEREVVLAVKRGEVDLAATVEMIDTVTERMHCILEGKAVLGHVIPLAVPDAPDYEEIEAWSIATHLRFWDPRHG